MDTPTATATTSATAAATARHTTPAKVRRRGRRSQSLKAVVEPRVPGAPSSSICRRSAPPTCATCHSSAVLTASRRASKFPTWTQPRQSVSESGSAAASSVPICDSGVLLNAPRGDACFCSHSSAASEALVSEGASTAEPVVSASDVAAAAAEKHSESSLRRKVLCAQSTWRSSSALKRSSCRISLATCARSRSAWRKRSMMATAFACGRWLTRSNCQSYCTSSASSSPGVHNSSASSPGPSARMSSSGRGDPLDDDAVRGGVPRNTQAVGEQWPSSSAASNSSCCSTHVDGAPEDDDGEQDSVSCTASRLGAERLGDGERGDGERGEADGADKDRSEAGSGC
mmetsp:Transcript_30115/g.82758  ORF Transcript_30115/g.82758 Transcript_30115/m.82758 type:complete len:343 (+) Transcript_30115:979-2007(+)